MSIIDRAYLKLLAKEFPTIQAASSEIIDLSATLYLPKGTEHFLSDVHGEFEAFSYILRSGSGSIQRKIDEILGEELDEAQCRELAVLIYYPREKLPLILRNLNDEERREWLRGALFHLIRLCRLVSTKYSRAALREALPTEFANIIEEMLHEQEAIENRYEYYNSILDTIINIRNAGAFIVALAELIQRLSIAHMHILGDIYDRSPGAHRIMDALLDYHSVDFQWGNHDIVWMGAASGSEACMANVIRVSLRYGNLETLENGYALSLLPLASFAMDVYGGDPCDRFMPRVPDNEQFTEQELSLMAQMHKAITIIQLKLEAQIIQRQPHYEMQDRMLLHRIDFQKGIVCLDGIEYPLLDYRFPTVDPDAPYQLTGDEIRLVERLKLSFLNSEKLQKHVRLLFSKGGLYRVHNGNLLYHGCIPMDADGLFVAFSEAGLTYAGRSFLDHLDRLCRQGYLAADEEKKQNGLDAMWYLWSGAQSPLFGKDKMATFERYFIADKTTHKEKMNPYYDFRDLEITARKILIEFGLDPERSHIINGHVPVKVSKGESPIKAKGRMLVIDGGFARAYQAQTGIAGYTLIFNSYGLLLASHQPFDSTAKFLEGEVDPRSQTMILETNETRIRVRDTDQGKWIQQRISELQALLDAYRSGEIKEKGW